MQDFTDEIDCQMLVDFLTDGFITINTGSTSSSIYPKKIKTPTNFSYRALRGLRDEFNVTRQYACQFDKINKLAKSLTGCELNHSWVSPDGKNFIVLAGPLNEPKLIWRRTGVGAGSFNSVFYRQRKHTIDSFVSNYCDSEEIKLGDFMELTPEWRARTKQLIREAITELEKPVSKTMIYVFRQEIEEDNARRKELYIQAEKILDDSLMFQVANRMMRHDVIYFSVQLGKEYFQVNKSDVVRYHKGQS